MQKVKAYLLPCCKQRLLEQENCGTALISVEILQKVLEDSEMGEREQEAMELELKARRNRGEEN